MKVAFIDSMNIGRIPMDPPRQKWNEAVTRQGMAAISYFPTKNLTKSPILICKDGKSNIVLVSLSIPFFSSFLSRNSEASRNLVRAFFSFLLGVLYLWKLMGRIRKDSIDFLVVIHLWEDPFMALLSPILGLVRPVAILWMGSSLRRYHQVSKWGYYFMLPVFKIVLRNAAILVPEDAEQKKYLFRVLKIRKENVFFFNPCIVDEREFSPKDKQSSASEVGFCSGNINILTVSRINNFAFQNKDYEKDILGELETFKFLSEMNDKVRLHIVGRGPGLSELGKKILKYGLQNKVNVYSAWLPYEKLALFYNAADLTFIPYPLIEINDSQAIFESLMCGTPVVAFKRYPWVSTDHRGGFLIDKDPKQGCVELLRCLNYNNLEKKSREAIAIPWEQDIPMSKWGKSLIKIISQLSEKLPTRTG